MHFRKRGKTLLGGGAVVFPLAQASEMVKPNVCLQGVVQKTNNIRIIHDLDLDSKPEASGRKKTFFVDATTNWDNTPKIALVGVLRALFVFSS